MRLSEAIAKFTNWRKFKVKSATVKGYDLTLKNFCLYLRDPELEAVTITDIMEYLNGMEQLGWERNSFVGKCMALRKFFEFYRLQHLPVVDEDLIPIAHKEFNIPRVATEENYQKLLTAIPTDTNDPRHIRNLAIVNLLWDTGARNGEVMALDVDDLQLDRMKAVIKTEKSKGRRPIREIFWTDSTNANLKRWLEKREELKMKMIMHDPEAVFISICSGALANSSGQRFSIKGVGEILRRYSNKAGIESMNAHSFRHHMGHDIVKKGGSSSDVMNILGHASLASSTIYTMMTDKELEARYRQFKGK
ncbi:MAG: tyrosine-type recombinase/integrase [Patescibacteria group bacterium]|nr:tyrosine-type recombinase/integrase [Patescibacteria group bacterium]